MPTQATILLFPRAAPRQIIELRGKTEEIYRQLDRMVDDNPGCRYDLVWH